MKNDYTVYSDDSYTCTSLREALALAREHAHKSGQVAVQIFRNGEALLWADIVNGRCYWSGTVDGLSAIRGR